MLSLLTTKTFKHLDEQHTAQLYSAVMLVETVGEVVGIPILSSTMIAGISIGGYGVGLPFYVCAVSFTSRTCRSAFAHGLTCASRAFTLPPALRSGSCDPASYGVPRYRTLRFNNIFIVTRLGLWAWLARRFKRVDCFTFAKCGTAIHLGHEERQRQFHEALGWCKYIDRKAIQVVQ